MARFDYRPDHAQLLRVLRSPDHLTALAPEQASAVMDAAEEARLLGWFVLHGESVGIPGRSPDWLVDRMIAARALVHEYDRSLRWEMNRLSRAFFDTDVCWVLLKGSGYLAAGLAPGKGRRVADIDILVSREQLPAAEQQLTLHGWEGAELDAYDQRYYRDWMHESPPMIHSERGSIVDVHHAILPLTGRLRPPTRRLLDRSVEASVGIRVLCPSHMVLHAAAHLFHDGEVAGAIRDLVDLEGLLRKFDEDPEFWPDFEAEAQALDLTRPAFYAIRYAHQWLGAPVPDTALRCMAAWGPSSPVLGLMDWLVKETLFSASGRASSLAALGLYIRSHWLRMPPGLLVRHLFHKAFLSSR